MSSGVSLDTLQSKQKLEDFIDAKRGGKCGIMRHRLLSSSTNSKSIWYIDISNLNVYEKMQKLLYNDRKYQGTCFADSNSSLDNILNTSDDSDYGFYINCDVDYNDIYEARAEQLALMPNKGKINYNELGYREREKGRPGTEKLVLDQNNKYGYMVFYRMLKFYVYMGAKVNKIHRVINFKQGSMCRDFIQNNTEERATAKAEADKDVKKIRNKSLYDRMCENPLDSLQNELLHDEEKIMKSISKSTFKNITRYWDYIQLEYIKKK